MSSSESMGSTFGSGLFARLLTETGTSDTRFARLVNLTGQATVQRVGNTTTPLTVADSSALAGPTGGDMGNGNFLANGPNNLVITSYGYVPENGQGSILLAGSYQGSIVVTISTNP